MNQYQYIVLDMDDTLLTSDNKVSKDTADYLIQIQQQGYHVILASGRPTEGMLPTAQSLKLDEFNSYIISYNGGKTSRVQDGKVETSRTIPKEQFDNIIDYCREHELFTLTYYDGYIVYDGEHEYMNKESELTGLPMKQVDDIKEYIQTDVPKVMGVDYESHIKELLDELGNQFNDKVDVTTSKPIFLEFMAKDVSKANTVSSLCEQLDIDIKQVIAFGDSSNDLSMLQEVGKGIAMANSNDEIKSVADSVTLSNDEDGIPYALKQIL